MMGLDHVWVGSLLLVRPNPQVRYLVLSLMAKLLHAVKVLLICAQQPLGEATTTTTLDSKCPVAIGTKPGPPPNLFLVTLSPIPMNLDAALAKLLKTLGVHEMDRVSAQDLWTMG
eukprot:g33324.t1